MTLWLVRHAPALIEPGVCYGALDVGADPAATLVCATALAAALPPVCRVFFSPLQRCAQLAQVLQTLRADWVFQSDGRLREMGFGSWEGQRWDGIDKALLAAWTASFPTYSPGDSCETVNTVMTRVSAALEDARQVANSPDVLWITHAGIIRAALLLAAGVRHVDRADQWPLHAPGHGQWRALDLRALCITPSVRGGAGSGGLLRCFSCQ